MRKKRERVKNRDRSPPKDMRLEWENGKGKMAQHEAKT